MVALGVTTKQFVVIGVNFVAYFGGFLQREALLSYCMIIGVKRNAERYKFWEPRLRVDPVWARSRRSRFSVCKAQPDLNFLVTFAKRRTFGPKIAFWAYFPIFAPQSRFWGPKRTFGPKIDFRPN